MPSAAVPLDQSSDDGAASPNIGKGRGQPLPRQQHSKLRLHNASSGEVAAAASQQHPATLSLVSGVTSSSGESHQLLDGVCFRKRMHTPKEANNHAFMPACGLINLCQDVHRSAPDTTGGM
jgi:hypothetical protein